MHYTAQPGFCGLNIEINITAQLRSEYFCIIMQNSIGSSIVHQEKTKTISLELELEHPSSRVSNEHHSCATHPVSIKGKVMDYYWA